MAISPDTARRYAQGTAAVVLVVGMFLVSSEAYRTRSVPLGPSETTTTTKSTTERKASAKGTETAEKHETTTASKETVVERALGQAGLWLGRFLLVVLVAFLSGGVVQRILLGEFALKAGPFELPPLPVQLSPVPDIVIEAFRVETTAQDVALGPPEAPVALTSSLVMTLLEQIQAPGPSDYAVIDLGTGRSWLTTRLFLFAVLLRRMRALRTFVFVETREGVAQRFIGVATPELARWRLAREYPWLERALAHAYAEVGDYDIRSDSGALELPAAGRLVDGFMQHPEIQAMESRPVDEWEHMPPGIWEHARWINLTLLERVLDLVPSRSSVIETDDLTGSARTRAVLAAEGAFVALVDYRLRFRSLVDRQALLEGVARRLIAAGPRTLAERPVVAL